MRSGLSLGEAQEAILAATPRLPSETAAVAEALRRVLAEPVVSTRRLPPADCSAMDGYAVRRGDCLGASVAAPAELAVAFEVAAGQVVEAALEPGRAARIFTGAPLPLGADAVVRQEDAEAAGALVRILVEPAPREHVRAAGEDLEPGERVLEPGRVLGPAELGLLASQGRSYVGVVQRPRVAILSGGDELVEPDGDAGGTRIVSSNSYTLAAQCRLAGAEPVYLGIARDDPASLEERLRAGLRAHCLVSSAGVSVGDHDHVRPVLEKLGCRLHFWGVKIKPGFPVTFGCFEDGDGSGLPLVFGLPGNPVSASVTFEQFVRPALRKLAGHTRVFRPVIRARLAADFRKQAGRLHLVRVSLERDRAGRGWLAHSTGNQSSGVLSSLARAHGLLVVPADTTELAAGADVTVQVLDGDFFDGEERGFPA